MENYISLLVAHLEALELLTEKEATALDKELRNTTVPGTYKEARVVVKDVLDKVRNK
jgi:hypothetical protein